MIINFNQKDAMNSDAGGLIDRSGNYKGKVTKAEIHKGNEQSIYITFGFENQNGEKIDYVNLYTKKKDGERCFGFYLVQALMGLLGLKSVEAKKVEENLIIPELVDRYIGFGLQKEWYVKSDGNIAWKMNLLRFYDVETNKTYTEMVSNKNPEKWELTIQDKGKPVVPAEVEGSYIDDDLPF